MPKPKKDKQECICGYINGDRDRLIICGEHYAEVVDERDRLAAANNALIKKNAKKIAKLKAEIKLLEEQVDALNMVNWSYKEMVNSQYDDE